MRWLGALAISSVVLLGATSSNAAPLAGLQLGFVRGTSVFVASSDGTQPRVVLRGKEEEEYWFDPAWSRSGRLAVTNETIPGGVIAYDGVLVIRPGRTPLAVRAAQGSGSSSPTWAPDNRRIALIGYNNPGEGTLYVARVGRTGTPVERRSIDDRQVDPAWSPDGETIAFVQREGSSSSSQLFVIRPDGTGRKRLTKTAARHPSWSPDSSRIVFDDGRGIKVINVDGSGLQRLTSPGAGATDPAWSPDGGQIAFVRGGSIWVMDESGKNPRRLIPNAKQPAWKHR